MLPTKPLRTDVFISSTYDDLIEYRTAVTEAILSLGLFPSGMENWPLRDENAIQLCQRKIDEAEVFVGIYAYRYGWTPDGYNGKSITELEYDWATVRGIPRLRFIMADTQPWPEKLKEKDAQPALNAFKSRLSKEMVKFFTTPDDLKAQVIAALVEYVPKTNLRALEPYLRWLHEESKRSGLLRVLNPRDATVDAKSVTVDKVYTPVYFTGVGHQAMSVAYNTNRLVVLGDPGSGKSTFLQFLTLNMTGHLLDPYANWMIELNNQGWKKGEWIPVIVTLRDFANDVPAGTSAGMARLLFDHIERQLARPRLEACFPTIKDALENGSALVLLDGLDEVPDESRDLVRDTVVEFIRRVHYNNRYIVTCRILSYAHETWKLPGFTEGTIAPFRREQIKHFIGAWYTALRELSAIDEPTAATRKQQLMAELQNEQIARIAENPMLLTVMAIVHNHGEGRLPREIAVLYDECVKLLMQKWRNHEASRLMDTLDLREIDLYRILYRIAFKAHDEQEGREGAADIPETDVQDTIMQALDCDQTQAKTFCDYAEEQAGLLIGRGQARSRWRMFSFPHRTIQEFLAGCYIATNQFYELVPELIEQGEKWRVAIALGTGHLVFNSGDNSAVVTAIKNLLSEHSERFNWQKVWLAGDMLALMGEHRARTVRRGENVVNLTIESLVELIEGGHMTPVERAGAGRTLCALGDPRRGVGLRRDGLPDIWWADEILTGTYWFGEKDQDVNLHHQIVITKQFHVSKYPITQAQYLVFQNDTSDAGYTCHKWWDGLAATDEEKRKAQPRYSYANHPMENVNWYQAVAFCRWLESNYREAGLITEHEEIRLPHEYEWEVAARGIDERSYSYSGDFDVTKCNTKDTGIGQTSAVGLFANGKSSCGAMDMTGNIWEFCLNRYEDGDTNCGGTDLRVLKGGSWLNANPDLFHCGSRIRVNPKYWHSDRGFRLVLC